MMSPTISAARVDGRMVEAAKIYLGGSMGAEPKLNEKGVPLSDLADELELLREQFGARRREPAGS